MFSILLDGHSSHYTLFVINKAAEEGIIMFCLPPHSTQPLDKGCFSFLKRYWREECHKYLSSNPGKVITRSMTIEYVISGFCTTGVYPINKAAVFIKTPDVY